MQNAFPALQVKLNRKNSLKKNTFCDRQHLKVRKVPWRMKSGRPRWIAYRSNAAKKTTTRITNDSPLHLMQFTVHLRIDINQSRSERVIELVNRSRSTMSEWPASLHKRKYIRTTGSYMSVHELLVCLFVFFPSLLFWVKIDNRERCSPPLRCKSLTTLLKKKKKTCTHTTHILSYRPKDQYEEKLET